MSVPRPIADRWRGAVAGVALALAGCATKPPGRLFVDQVQIAGTRQLDEKEVLAKLSTHASSTLFGFVLDYEVYDPFVVDRDIARIERHYRARGFHQARVTAARVLRGKGDAVNVEVTVVEGAPTIVSLVRIDRAGNLTTEAGAAVAKAQNDAVKLGQRFDEDGYADLKRGVLRALTDSGYARAEVSGAFTDRDLTPDGGDRVLLDPTADAAKIAELNAPKAPDKNGDEPAKVSPKRYGVRVDAVRGTAEIRLRITAGPRCAFGPIRIEGLGDLPEARIRNEIILHEGEEYSSAELESAKNALLELGLFSSVDVDAEVPPGTGTIVPVTFKLARAPDRTLTLGGGLQVDVLHSDAHFVVGYEKQNFLGGLRRLTVQAKPGLVFFPTNLENALPPTRIMPQIATKGELRQPSFLEARTNGTLRQEFLVYPYLLPARNAAEVPDVVVGYRELRSAAGIDRKFTVFNHPLTLALFYNVQISYPFAYFGALDAGISRVVISYVSATQAYDLRDNAVKPHRGAYFANEVQIAGGFGDAKDVRIQPDVRFYAPISSKVTLGFRSSVGFLFPSSYGGTLSENEPNDPTAAALFNRERNRDLQILFFRAFFSGGPTSNRGYPFRGVGPRGIAPFHLGGSTALRDCVGRVSGSGGASTAASQIAMLPTVDPDLCAVPLGGLSLWESSLELRVQLSDSFSTSFFLDGSDVTRKQLQLRFDYPHLSTGTGIRYDTPVGPIRLDLGYAIPGLQHIGHDISTEVAEGQPATLLGIPIAINIAVGEAF